MQSFKKISLNLMVCGFAWLATPVMAQQIKTVYFSENQVVKVRTGLGIATQIVIDPNEEVKQYGTGFTNAWNITREDNTFYLSPKQERADTNMFINTNKRRYLLELEVVTTKWKDLKDAKDSGVNYKVVFVYDKNQMPKEAPPPAVPAPSAGDFLPPPNVPTAPLRNVTTKNKLTGFNKYHLNYDVKASGDSEAIVPLRVYDDDQFTYIVMPPKVMPSVFSRDTESGDENVVNKSVDGETIKVHGLYNYLILRDGERVVGLRRNKDQEKTDE